MTYYKVKKYLMERGLTEGQADRVRGMIRKMLKEDRAKPRFEEVINSKKENNGRPDNQ